MRGRGKGSKFERVLCRELSLWWTRGERDDVFWRTSQSGGRSKTRMKTGRKTFGQYGDIQAVDPIGRPLLDLLTIEAKKGYNKETAFNALDRIPKSGSIRLSKWEGFLHQAQVDSHNAGTPYWLLIHKRDQRNAMVFVPTLLFIQLPHLIYCRPQATLMTKGGERIFCTTLPQFKKNVDPAEIQGIVSRRKRVIRVRMIVGE